MMKMSLRALGLPLVLGAALALGACGAKGSGPGQAGDPNATTQGEHGAPGARLPFLDAVLRLDDLSGDQRAKIDAIAADYQTAIAPRRVAGAALANLFATALETGKADDAAIDAKLAELEATAVAEKTALSTALDSMHATLTPAQRTALVESIRSRHHDGKGMFGGGKHEHDGNKSGLHGPLRHLLGDLDLTEAQQQAFADRLAEPKPIWDRAANMAILKAIGDDFTKDTFDAKSHDLSLLGGPAPSKMATKMRKVVAVSLEVLDQGQRTKLATKLRDFATKMQST